MALSYDDAMSALRAMFPSWDATALADVLEANEGHFENTIDMVLVMDPPAASPAASPAAAAAAHSPPPTSRKSPNASPRRKTDGERCSRVSLPPDFLVLPDDDSGRYHVLSEQEQRDAALAEMLQNEIFRQELLESEEFAEHFNGDRPRSSTHGGRPSASSRGSAGAYPEKSAAEIASETFNAMSVKFSSMSEVMKKKASEMYMRFQTRSDSRAEKDPYSHRPLMADDSSDDEDFDGKRAVRHRHKDNAGSLQSPLNHTSGPMWPTNASVNKKNE
ncbi:hypothetical protein PybrP1_011037 [[Pythium] brassicae (nom. inval.)]|nr:hypothetical protein PybrP1_011037 [[Pythium] brassicae (nom. inval.)]